MIDIQIERYRKQFYQETREILDAVYDDILKAEGDPTNSELLNAIFRGIHTIKGSIGIFELDTVAWFTHQLENVLIALRDGKIQLTSEIVDILLAGVDHIGQMIQDYEHGKKPTIDSELVDKCLSCLKTENMVKPTVAETEPDIRPITKQMIDIKELSLPTELFDQIQKLSNRGYNIFRIHVKYTSEHMENGYDPYPYLKKLHQSSCLYHVIYDPAALPIPPLDSFNPMTLYLQPTIIIATENSYEFIQDLAFDPSLVSIEVVNCGQIHEQAYKPPEIVDPESLKEFIIGSSEMLESAEHAVLAYESTGNPALLNEIFRVVHNIKGDADFVGLKKLNTFAHTLESFLDKLRSGEVIKNSIDILLKSIDYFWRCIRKLNQGIEITDYPPIYETLIKLTQPKPESSDKPNPVLSDSKEEIKRVFSDQLVQYKSILLPVIHTNSINQAHISIIKRALKGLVNASSSMNVPRLKELAQNAIDTLHHHKEDEMIQSIRTLITYIDEMEIEPKRIGEILIQEGKLTEQDLDECLTEQKRIGEILVRAGKVTQEDVEQALKRQELAEIARQMKTPPSSELEIKSMRVDESKIEQLTNIVGELLIARNAYDFILNQLNRSGAIDREIERALKENLYLFTRLTNDIHYGVMSLRMIPVGNIFRKFGRVVRDIARKQKKSIELIIEGETVEIDKKAADALADPLIHLIRNACDHGIEPPKERLAKGKPEKGKIVLKAFNKGGYLCMSVSDDGIGLNRQKIYEKAKTMGLDPKSPDDPNLLDLIFLPGFSTRSETTDISGRGVGMDVVKTTVQSLGGNVKLVSEENKGTEVILFIPMTMGIDSVLLVQISGQSYAIPLASIESTLKIPKNKIKRAVDRQLFYHRGDIILLERLDTLLHGKKKNPTKTNSPPFADEIPVVIMKTGKGKIGVIVDHFEKNMELAVKPLPSQLSGLNIATGVSIMGDGKIILVINPDNL